MEMNREDLTVRDNLIYHAMTGVCTPNFMKHLYLSWTRDPFYSIEEIVNSYVPMSNETKQQKLKMALETAYNKLPYEELKELYRIKNIQVLTILDNGYPEGWLNSYLPPVVVFCAGNIRLLEQPCLSVVGSRSPTAYGKAVIGRNDTAVGCGRRHAGKRARQRHRSNGSFLCHRKRRSHNRHHRVRPGCYLSKGKCRPSAANDGRAARHQ